MIKFVIMGLATLTLIGQCILVGLLAVQLLKKKFKKELSLTVKLLSHYRYQFSFVVSLVATLGSLFFSEVAKFQPCILCWYQRIFMYPQPVLLYLGILRKETVLKPYLTALNLVGLGIALYHYLLQIQPKLLTAPCVTGDVSCVRSYTFYFGYITIPLMAATAFALNLLFISFTASKKGHA